MAPTLQNVNRAIVKGDTLQTKLLEYSLVNLQDYENVLCNHKL